MTAAGTDQVLRELADLETRLAGADVDHTQVVKRLRGLTGADRDQDPASDLAAATAEEVVAFIDREFDDRD